MDIAKVRTTVAAQLPHYRVDFVVPIGEGLDNTAFDVNGELIVRFSKDPDPQRLDREARLLNAIAEIAPLPVPKPIFTVAELGCMAYAKLPGRPLLELSAPHHGIAATLGDFLTTLHAIPVESMTDLVDTDDRPLAEWRNEAAATYPTIARHVPPEHRPKIEAFLIAPPPDSAYEPVFSHNDLGIEHVLVDPVTGDVTGIIDWSDAAIVDPAYDFGLLYRDLGVLPRAGLEDRAVFYARCKVLEDLAYGIETGSHRYVDKSLAALEWTFKA